MKVLSPKEAQAFLDECSNSKDGLLFEFALITGMPPEEYLALQWSDLDLKQGTATIQRVLVRNRTGGGRSFQPPKTPRSFVSALVPLIIRRREIIMTMIRSEPSGSSQM